MQRASIVEAATKSCNQKSPCGNEISTLDTGSKGGCQAKKGSLSSLADQGSFDAADYNHQSKSSGVGGVWGGYGERHLIVFFSYLTFLQSLETQSTEVFMVVKKQLSGKAPAAMEFALRPMAKGF